MLIVQSSSNSRVRIGVFSPLKPRRLADFKLPCQGCVIEKVRPIQRTMLVPGCLLLSRAQKGSNNRGNSSSVQEWLDKRDLQHSHPAMVRKAGCTCMQERPLSGPGLHIISELWRAQEFLCRRIKKERKTSKPQNLKTSRTSEDLSQSENLMWSDLKSIIVKSKSWRSGTSPT